MRILIVTLLLLAFAAPAAALGVASPEPAGLKCRRAIAAAEKVHDIPPHLLAAIARTESGRRDPTTGELHPWPWTINAAGEGHYYDTKAEAIAAVRAFQGRGVTSIDVGCMQVNLKHHPTAFANLEQAFDPTTNADYAARFLRSLHGQTGTWPLATGMYHSATPELAEPYRRQVLAAWPTETKNQQGVPATTSLASAWSATLPASRPVMASFQRGPIGGTIGGTVGGQMGGRPAARIIPLTRAADGSAPLGRDLAAYRASPVFVVSRPTLGRGG